MAIKILLVDDNPTFVAAVSAFLEQVPGVLVVGHAADGREGLTQIELLKPDLVLLDIAMPEMNGLEMAARLRGQAECPRLVFLSMHDSGGYHMAAHGLGASFVNKANFVDGLLPIITEMQQDRQDSQD
ncbi:LytR/AlgR family response regulator transcription factor [Roseateles oligotrophus]|uniref:Response regulator transcription factor n=1 Tax=Roseateles oligotrophus TaxID=1769250 RepID=A0ABT2YFS1_9BURK|nr:response regulator transcription factor [Roseateles oligotrophus]MCV2368917.1 response regulator transcription factor [Roseateles oligotrophus]